jgi:hypothetical protein
MASTIMKKAKVESPELEKKVNQSVEDWDQEEEQEQQPRKRNPDYICDVVGKDIYFPSYSAPWYHRGDKLFVTRYFPHLKLVVDFPQSEQEDKIKREVIVKDGHKYLSVLPGERLTIEQFKERVNRVLGKKTKKKEVK